MKSRLTLAGICLLAAFGLAACGGGGGSTGGGGGGGGTGTGTGSTGTTDAAPTAVAGVDHTTGLLALIAADGTDGVYSPEEAIPAGGSKTYGGVEFTCAAGGEECALTLAVTQSETGVDMVSAESTGGEVTATFVDPLGVMNPVNIGKVAAILNVAPDGPAAPPFPRAPQRAPWSAD